MMTDHTDLIARLRADARRVENPELYETQSLELYAADALEAQGRQIEGWKEEARRQAGNRDYWKARCEEGAKT